MEKITNKISVQKEAWKLTKNKFSLMSVPLCIFAVLTVIVFIAGYFSSLSMLLLTPFVIIPGIFALTVTSVYLENSNDGGGVTFFSSFRMYFSPFARGGYRVIIGILFSCLFYFGSSLVLSIVLNNTLLINDPSFIEFRKSIASIEDIDTLYELVDNFLKSNKTFQDIVLITSVSSTFIAVWYFIHHISVNSLKYFNNMLSKTPLPISDLNIIHKATMKNIKKPFRKDYYGSLWMFLILIPVGYIGGVSIGKFVLTNMSADHCVVLGFFTIFVLCLLFIPYYLNVMEVLFKKYSPNYLETFVNLSLQSIEQIKKTQNIDPEKEKKILEFLEEQKKNLHSKDEENKDKNNSEE